MHGRAVNFTGATAIDPTVNQHAQFVGIRKGVVERRFVIDARGPGW